MVGREVDLLYTKKRQSGQTPGDCLLELEQVGKKGFVHDISLKLHREEILGVFGLQGSGVEKLPQILYGLDTCDSGIVRVKGQVLRRRDTAAMLKKGFIYLNDNRKRAGLFLDMRTADHMACPRPGQ